jgi:hypothetical protein
MVKVIIQCERERTVCENHFVVVVICFFLLHISYARNRGGGMCYTTKCDTVEDGLTGRALEGNSDG